MRKLHRPVSRKILSLEIDLSTLITMTTIVVFSVLKITTGLKIFPETAPWYIDYFIINWPHIFVIPTPQNSRYMREM